MVIDALPKDGVFNVIRRESKLESEATLDGVLTVVVRPEGLRVGDVLDVAMTLRRDDPLLVGAFDESVQGFDPLPLAHLRIRATWPDQSATRWRASDAFGPLKVVRAGGDTTIGVDLDNLQPLVTPRDAPPRYQHGRRLEISSYAQWSDVSAKLQPLFAEAARLQPGGPLADEVKAIATKTSDQTARLLAALSLVEDKVRYFDQAIGDGGLRPASADLTWSRRWGDCKAKMVLLVAMLQALGIQAEPVYVSVTQGDGLDQRLPSLGVFDHVVVRATIGGHDVWLDGTRVGDVSIADLRKPSFGWVLPIRAKGAALIQLRADPFDTPQSVSKLDLDASHGLSVPAKAHGEFVARGDAGKSLHTTVGNLSPEALDNALHTFWVRRYDFVTPQTMSAKYDAKTGEETLIFEGTAKLDWDSGYEADGASLGWKLDTHRASGSDSDAPFLVAYPFYETTEQTIVLPYGGAGFTINGDNVDKDLSGFHFYRHTAITGGAFHLEASTRALVPEISIVEAQQAEEAMTALSKTTIHVKAPLDYGLTMAEMNVVLATEPTTASAYSKQAGALLDAGRYREAINSADKSIALDSKNAHAFALRGIAHVWLREDTLAGSDLDNAEKLDPKDRVLWRARGLMAEKNQRWSEAILQYNKALSIESNDSFALSHLITVYTKVGDVAAALAAADQVFKNRNEQGGQHAIHAMVYFNAHDTISERKELSMVAPEGKTESDRRMQQIKLMRGIGDREGALQEAANLIATAPSPTAYLLHASLRPRDDFTGALADATKAEQLDPKSEAAVTSLARIEGALKHYPEAEAWSGKALALASNDKALLYYKAELDLKSGAPPDDIKSDFSRIRTLSLGDAAALNELCWTEATSGVDFTEALGDCEASLKLNPTNSATLDSRGFALLRLGRNTDAIKAYGDSISASPVAESYYGRSLAEARTNAREAADRDRRTAVTIDPNVEKEFAGYGLTR